MKNFKNKRVYALCSISIIMTLALTACAASQNKTTSNSSSEPTSQQQNTSGNNNSTTNESNKEKNETNGTNEINVINMNNSNVPKIVKQQLEKGSKARFNTPWKSSPSGTYSACVEGKGPEAIEEGVGQIFVKNNSGDIFSFKIQDNEKISPKFIQWADGENLLVVIGSAHGTVSKGGNLYLLNVNSGKMFTVLEIPDKKQEIMSVEKNNDSLKLKVNVYDDNNYNKSHTENWTVSSFNINLNNKMQVKNSEGKVIFTINYSN
ncbi:DUF4652 domain-containing protein [Clostridium sp. DJ247]|uniref:DUF4652 domain-containing protein n=1 Tax=Clostridium sp. DJ247 TaxID=2726188 RepID=UPI0016238D49|nr:DUF4652 domain-containing protein [Clostridium sp. DJ247]MBC2579612.1 DUF4652 domain-containing protein [Clostridium sp. DJ247]